MWGSGLMHGLWMVVGWLFGLFAVGIAIYAAVRLATHQTITKLVRTLENQTRNVNREPNNDATSTKP